MIDDLDKTLEELLKRELPPALVSQITLSFATPDEQFPPTSVALPAIDLFLYALRENNELRSNEWLLERRDDGTATRTRPPVRVECSYLITAWPSASSNSPAQDEHRLLGAVMQVLLRHPTIPPTVLQGSLREQEPPLPAVTLQPGQLQNMTELWQALGGKPRAALNYTVTMGVQVQPPAETGPLVREAVLRLRHTAGEHNR